MAEDLAQRLAAKFPGAIEAIPPHRDLPSEVTFKVAIGSLIEVCRYLRDSEEFNFLTDLCGVHYPERDKKFEVVYHLFSIGRRNRVRLKVLVNEGEKVPSVVGIWGTANWFERECFDMFGLIFDGHPNLKRILLPDDWQGHPLRKDYPLRSSDA